MIRAFLKDESGATAIEYGLIAALFATACVVALEALSTSVTACFARSKANAKRRS
jgi:pilus assembly protein Flp/PilA